jgi:protoheme IX farnesyltransferase
MNRISTEIIVPAIQVPIGRDETAPGLMGDLVELVKARLTLLVLITTFVGFCMASGGRLDLMQLFYTLIGTALVAAASQTLNQVIEVDVDRLMERTKDRPLPAGRIKRIHALLFGAAMAASGLVVLAVVVNIPAACMAAATLLIYLGLYTPLKRHTPFCITVGAVAGAIPPALGWVAAKPSMDAGAWVLFAILFFWQMPHFLAIAWMYREEYAGAGFVMLRPKDTNGSATAAESFIFTVALLAAAVAPYFLGLATPVYLAGAVVLNAVMLFCAVQFLLKRTRHSSRRLFFASIIYLPVLLALLVFARA